VLDEEPENIGMPGGVDEAEGSQIPGLEAGLLHQEFGV